MGLEATQFKPGQSGNPEGHNQYTYRRDFELAIDDLLKGVYEFRREVLEDEEGAQVRCLFCNFRSCDVYVGHQLYAHNACIDQVDALSRGQVIALVTVQRAMAGDEKMLPTVLDRLWPKVEKREHAFPDPAEAGDVVAALAEFARAKRANGDAREDEPAGPDGANGSRP